MMTKKGSASWGVLEEDGEDVWGTSVNTDVAGADACSIHACEEVCDEVFNGCWVGRRWAVVPRRDLAEGETE